MIKEIRIETKKIMAENGIEFEYMFSERRAKQRRTLKFFNLRCYNSVKNIEQKIEGIAVKLQELYSDANIKVVKQHDNRDVDRFYNKISLRVTANE